MKFCDSNWLDKLFSAFNFSRALLQMGFAGIAVGAAMVSFFSSQYNGITVQGIFLFW